MPHRITTQFVSRAQERTDDLSRSRVVAELNYQFSYPSSQFDLNELDECFSNTFHDIESMSRVEIRPVQPMATMDRNAPEKEAAVAALLLSAGHPSEHNSDPLFPPTQSTSAIVEFNNGKKVTGDANQLEVLERGHCFHNIPLISPENSNDGVPRRDIPREFSIQEHASLLAHDENVAPLTSDDKIKAVNDHDNKFLPPSDSKDITDTFASMSSQEVHFPSVLHGLLTTSEFSGTVLEWLPEGMAWRVLRWDLMCSHVIPTCFPYLCTGAATENEQERKIAFITRLNAFGFKEVKEIGSDTESYRQKVGSCIFL